MLLSSDGAFVKHSEGSEKMARISEESEDASFPELSQAPQTFTS